MSDIRWKDPESLYDVFNNVEKLAKCNMEIHKVLKADKPTIIDRYKKSRRIHPLEKSLEIAIDEEIKVMSGIEKICDIVIDTTSIEPTELKRIFQIINENLRKLRLNIISFGFKKEFPLLQIINDVRYLPNPFYFPKCIN